MSVDALSVTRLGDDRIRIQCDSPDSPSVPRLMSWLSARREVLEADFRPASRAIVVRYADRDVPGAFARALEDRIYTLAPVPEPDRYAVVLSHSLDGRARLRFAGVGSDDVVRIAAFLAQQPGVLRANASPAAESIRLYFDPAVTTAQALATLARTSTELDWPPAPAPERKANVLPVLGNTAVLAACVVGASVVPEAMLAAGVVLTAIPPVKRALHALRHEQRLSVDMLDVAAIGVSLATGQPTTAAFITWLLGIGDVLLEYSADRARQAISRLMSLDAQEAWRVAPSGETVRVSADKLVPGDRIVVGVGQRVAADGIVAQGVASVDEKALTGESELRERRTGDRILAATVVVEGQIVVDVERTGTDTTAAKIVKILEGAGAKPMTLQRNAERVADKLVLPTFGLAGASAALTGMVDRATSVLITDFGTGIRIAVPTSALAAMTMAARRGVLVKGAQYLERLSRADAVVFDKTGTLTTGTPAVVCVLSAGRFTADELLAACASAESHQSHPIAEAVRAHAEKLGVAVPEPALGSEVYAVGLGLGARVEGRDVLVGGSRWMKQHGLEPACVAASLETVRAAHASSLMIAIDGKIEGVLGYADRMRDESPAIVHALRAGGRRRIVLLSGDAPGPVEAVARAVGADEFVAEMLPEDKAAYVKELQRRGLTVAMVGDGINDAPALALADVGISLHGGTDVALETADVVLLEGGLERIGVAFDTGDQAMAMVRRGLGIVIVPNAIAIVLGALGVINPAIAAAVNNGTTVVAALSSLAPLLRAGRDKKEAR